MSEDVANEAQAQIKAGNSWKMLVEEKQGELQGDSGRFELTQINGNANAVLGSFSPVVKNVDGTATFMQYFKIYGGGEQRSFEDSKGMVINDYQNVVEKRWIEELRKKYQVKVNEVLLKQIAKEAN